MSMWLPLLEANPPHILVVWCRQSYAFWMKAMHHTAAGFWQSATEARQLRVTFRHSLYLLFFWKYARVDICVRIFYCT